MGDRILKLQHLLLPARMRGMVSDLAGGKTGSTPDPHSRIVHRNMFSQMRVGALAARPQAEFKRTHVASFRSLAIRGRFHVVMRRDVVDERAGILGNDVAGCFRISEWTQPLAGERIACICVLGFDTGIGRRCGRVAELFWEMNWPRGPTIEDRLNWRECDWMSTSETFRTAVQMKNSQQVLLSEVMAPAGTEVSMVVNVPRQRLAFMCPSTKPRNEPRRCSCYKPGPHTYKRMSHGCVVMPQRHGDASFGSFV